MGERVVEERGVEDITERFRGVEKTGGLCFEVRDVEEGGRRLSKYPISESVKESNDEEEEGEEEEEEEEVEVVEEEEEKEEMEEEEE